MKKSLPIAFAAIACMLACSCKTVPQKRQVVMDSKCIIQTEAPGVLVEVRLDGGLVFSSKTATERDMHLSACNLATSPGKHNLSVSASGYAKWEKEITVVGGTSQFWAELRKQ